MVAQFNDIAQIWWQWMAGMFWQVSLLIIIITLLDMAIRRWAWPQVRYVLWGLVFIKLIIPPIWQMPTSIVSWIQPKVEEQISIQIEAGIVTAEDMQISVSDTSFQNQGTKPVAVEQPSWQAIVLLTWLTGMMAFSLMLIIRLSRLPRHSEKQGEQDAPEWFHELLTKTAQRLNLKKIPTIVFSKDTKSPAVYGIFKPVLLLPAGCLNQLSKEQAEHVLIHELCHLKRGDLVVHWFCLVLQVVYWFNPLLIWARRQMRYVCEICCDLSVADILREKTIAYRNTLLSTARDLLTETVEPGLGLLGVFEEPFRLVTRLKWLEKKTWENRKRKIAATIVTSLIIVVCVMPMAGLSQSASNDHRNYKSGLDYSVKDESADITYPAVFYEACVVEVDEDKSLDLGAAEYFGVILFEQVQELYNLQADSSIVQVNSTNATINSESPSELKVKRSPDPLNSKHNTVIGIASGRSSAGSPSYTGSVALPIDPAIDISASSDIGMLKLFRENIIFNETTYPDMETALKTIEYRTVLVRNILVPINKIGSIKILSPTEEREHGLKITPQILENVSSRQKIELTLYGYTVGMGINDAEINNGDTLVISGPIFNHAASVENSADRTKLYIFITPHVLNTKKVAQDYFKTNKKEPAIDVTYTNPSNEPVFHYDETNNVWRMSSPIKPGISEK